MPAVPPSPLGFRLKKVFAKSQKAFSDVSTCEILALNYLGFTVLSYAMTLYKCQLRFDLFLTFLIKNFKSYFNWLSYLIIKTYFFLLTAS